jgi:hypothetical protein
MNTELKKSEKREKRGARARRSSESNAPNNVAKVSTRANLSGSRQPRKVKGLNNGIDYFKDMSEHMLTIDEGAEFFPEYERCIAISNKDVASAFNKVYPRYRATLMYCKSQFRRMNMSEVMDEIQAFLMSIIDEANSMLSRAENSVKQVSKIELTYALKSRLTTTVASLPQDKLCDLFEMFDRICIKLETLKVEGQISEAVYQSYLNVCKSILLQVGSSFQRLVQALNFQEQRKMQDWNDEVQRLAQRNLNVFKHKCAS